MVVDLEILLTNFYNSFSNMFSNVYLVLILVIVVGYIQSLIVSSMLESKLSDLMDNGIIKPKIDVKISKNGNHPRIYIDKKEHFTDKPLFKQKVRKPKGEHFTQQSKKQKNDTEHFTQNFKRPIKKNKKEHFKQSIVKQKTLEPIENNFPYDAYNNEDNCYTSLNVK